MERPINVAFIVMYSSNYVMTGETHGVSVLAGVVKHKFNLSDENILILDMYGASVIDKRDYICTELKRFLPDVVGFSCPYGSYSAIKDDYPYLKTAASSADLYVFGGALPTYIPDQYLKLDESAYVIRGEGEEAICSLIEMWRHKNYQKIDQIPNICFVKGGVVHYNPRKVVDLHHVVAPYRKHIGSLLRKDAQIYVERSRGCTWSNCTFCSRNLLSLENDKKNRYRLFPIERLRQDLKCLQNMGIRAVTFSDEDFCGGGIDEMEEVVDVFSEINNMYKLMTFDVSMNVNSIYCDTWDFADKKRRFDCLRELKAVGLRKIFLGVESGSDSQLVRYRKQHKTSEAVHAIRILEECGFQVEMGYIIYDPLCSIDEVIDDLFFLKKNNFAKYVSSLGSGLDLRLHMDTPYVRLLQEYEKKNKKSLHSDIYDYDTLNYKSKYLHHNVEMLADYTKEMNALIRPLYYPLKSLSRYGEHGSLRDYIPFVKQIVVSIRNQYLDCLIETAQCVQNGLDASSNVKRMNSFIFQLFQQNKEKLFNIAYELSNGVLLDVLISYEKIVQ